MTNCTLARFPRIQPLFALAVAAALTVTLSTPVDAEAKTRRAGAAKSQRLSKTKFDQGSAESTKERERRMYRECKGRPNAGACEGFAS